MLFSQCNIADSVKDVLIAIFWCKGSVDTSLFGSLPAIGPLWFLVALFWGCLIVSNIKRIKEEIIQFLIVVLLFTLSYMTIHKVRLPFCVQLGMSCSLFIWIGSMLMKYKVLEILQSSKVAKCISFILWMLSIIGGSLYMNGGFYGLGLISIISSVCATVLIFCIFQHTNITGGWIGKNTLTILCVHSALLFTQTNVSNPFSELAYHPIINFIIEAMWQVALALLLSYMLSYIPFMKNILKIRK